MDITFDDIKQILAETASAQKTHSAQLAILETKLTAQTEDMRQQTEAMKQQTEDLKQKLAIEKSELEKKLAFEKTDLERTIKQTKKQLGELGNKLGSFAEGLAYPTVERIML
jgi:septal ring factor EnvC (AmiA/AmiB activator)